VRCPGSPWGWGSSQSCRESLGHSPRKGRSDANEDGGPEELDDLDRGAGVTVSWTVVCLGYTRPYAEPCASDRADKTRGSADG
jgi:hypothetical protein